MQLRCLRTSQRPALSQLVSATFSFTLLGSKTSAVSKASFQSRTKEAKEKEQGDKADWNASTTSEQRKVSAEDRMASQIASEVLKDNAKLRAVHSKESIKAILEREAKRQMKMAVDKEYPHPVISEIKE